MPRDPTRQGRRIRVMREVTMNKLIRSFIVGTVLLGSGAALAESHKDAKKAPAKTEKKEKSLYLRLGGLNAIKSVVKDFLGNVAEDKRINKRFASSDIPKLQKLLVDQVCMATGGPCKYKGKTMAEAH